MTTYVLSLTYRRGFVGFQSDAVSDGFRESTSNAGQQSQGRLKKYIHSFGSNTAREMARVISQEATTLIEMQTVALFGDYRLLQKEMEVHLSLFFHLSISTPECFDTKSTLIASSVNYLQAWISKICMPQLKCSVQYICCFSILHCDAKKELFSLGGNDRAINNSSLRRKNQWLTQTANSVKVHFHDA